MCILFLAFNQNDDFPIIVATNRDEDVARSAKPAHFWIPKNGEKVIGGLDVHRGGTWLAASNRGRIGIILNCVRPDALGEGFQSRGEIVTQFMESNLQPSMFPENLVSTSPLFKPFNFVGIHHSGSPTTQPACFVVTKPDEETSAYCNQLQPGSYVIGNSPFGSSACLQKMNRGKTLFDNVLNQISREKPNFDRLQQMLVNEVLKDTTSCCPDTELERIWSVDRHPLIPCVSRVFVSIPKTYQTRCSTIVAVDKQGLCHFYEYTWKIISSASFTPEVDNTVYETFQMCP